MIPRGSGNEKAISDYLVDFAKKDCLELIQDKAMNVIIKKPGTPGYENSPAVIIQGHMDMVCDIKVECLSAFYFLYITLSSMSFNVLQPVIIIASLSSEPIFLV